MHIYIDDNSNPLKEFQLPADFLPELSRTNPFLTDEGSQSIPLTLPASDHNMNLTGWQYRSVASKRPMRKTPAVWSDKSIWSKGTLYITDVNPKEGIDCTFYYNEGRLYEKTKDLKMKDLDWPVKQGVGSDAETKAKYWMDHFIDVMEGKAGSNPDYYIFSVVSDSDFIRYKIDSSNLPQKLILNLTASSKDSISYAGWNQQTYYSDTSENATTYTVPVGYGVTPFLRMGFVLRHLFSYFGYTLRPNVFDTEVSLMRLCLLNNTADTIVSGVLDYSQLVPGDMTVEDFIEIIRKKFAIEFIEYGNEIEIVSWNKVLDASPDQDLSKYMTDNKTWISQTPKSIFIEYEPSQPVEDYLVEYQTLKHDSVPKTEEEDLSTSDKIPFFKTSILYYFERTGSVWPMDFPAIGNVSHKNSELMTSEGVQDEKESKSEVAMCFYLPGLQKRKMEYSVEGESTPEKGIQHLEEYYSYYTGTVWSYDREYKKWGTLTLVANEINKDYIIPDRRATDNIYNKFYKKRDAMLLYANQQVTYEAFIPPHVILGMDIIYPKIVNGQKVLIERIDFAPTQPDLCLVTARTMHQYEDL